MKNYSLVILLSFILAACDYGIEWVDGEYAVHWVHAPHNTLLARKTSDTGSIDRFNSKNRVDARVLAIGSNDKYIVAKQRNHGSDSISYFVIDKSKDSKNLNQDEITHGPLSESKFLELKNELGLPEFTKEF